MALTQILFDRLKRKGFVNPGEKPGTETIALELDVIIIESPEYNATPTKNPIETGANVSDHVTLETERLTIEGIVSNTPVSLVRTLSGVTFSDPAKDAFAYLIELYNNRQPFSFVGDLKTYENMVITSFNPSRTQQTGKVLQFTMSMDQVRLVQSQIGLAENFDESVEATASEQQELGTQSVEEATAEATTQAQTLLTRLSDAIF